MKHKLKRIFKRTVPLVLVCTLTIGAVLGHNTKKVKALTGVEEAALVTAILLAYGYVTTRYFNDTDGANALKNDMEQAYEETRFKVLNGGASGGGGDEDPDDNDFEDTDGDGKITEKDIPQFKEISLPGKAAFALSANTALLLSPIIKKFILNESGIKEDNLNYAKQALSAINDRAKLFSSRYKYSVTFGQPTSTGVVTTILFNGNVYIDNDGTAVINIPLETPGYVEIDYDFEYGKVVACHENASHAGDYMTRNPQEYVKKGYIFKINAPFYNSFEDFKNRNLIIWVTPDLQNIFENNGKLEVLPPYSPNFNYNMPTQQALQELLNNLQSPGLDPIGQKQLVLDYINSLKTEVTPAPDPSPDPKPEPNPEPNPDPNPEPNPDENKDNEKFTADLKTLFPFCIPFDLVDCFKLFNAEPETPRIEVPMHFGIIDVDYTWVIDLKDFDSVAVICRSMFLILFLVGLALATSKVIKW